MRALRILAIACLLAVGGTLVRAAEQRPDPIASFARHDEVIDARLSPGGTTLALVRLRHGHRTLGLVELSSRKMLELKLGGDAAVGAVHWVSDDRLVAELVEEGGELAAPRLTGELYTVRADGTGGHVVFGYRAAEMQTGSHLRKAGMPARAWARVVGRLRRDSHHALIETTAWDEVGDRLASVWRLDAVSGVKDLVTRSPMPGAAFLVDEDGQARIAGARDEGDRLHFFLREAGGAWTELAELKGVTPVSAPVAFSSRERTLYVEERDDAGFCVVAISLDSGERKELARNGLVPPSGLVLDATHRLVAVEFTPDLPEYAFVLPDHPLARALRGLAEAYPDERVRFVDASDDGTKLVVEVHSDRDPGRYLVVDAATMTADPVAEVRPWVKADDGAEVTAFHIRAGDGLRIHGYVTLPRAGGEAPPMVVIPHGGPHRFHDTWGYDAEAQLLASQGFAVLQVNYRGSGGYGHAYEEAGYGHWGDRMIEDVVDATRFAVRKGWADARRVCIYGASYGGYAALQAAIVAPDLYRCAAGLAGVYDLERLPDAEPWIDSPLARAHFKTHVGSDPAALRRFSPAFNAERLTVPVLLIHGEKDRRVPVEQAERMRKALVAQGRPPEWLVEPNEGHGFYDEEARARLYTRLLAFLRANTRPPEPAPAR